MMYEGKVVWFDAEKGKGLIIDIESGESFFVNYQSIESNEKFKTLTTGNKVKYQTRQTLYLNVITKVKEIL